MTKFPERLKQLRKSSGITQQALADTLKISKSSVNMYERGEREPGLNLLEAIADVFNVDMNYITGNCDIPRKSLVTCNNPQVLPPDFTDDEVDLLNKYNRLDNYGKEVVSLVSDAEIKRCEEQNTTPKMIRSFIAAHSVDNHEPKIADMEDLSKYPVTDEEF